MKLLIRIVSVLIAGLISVLAVQLIFRRIYLGLGRKYVELPAEHPEHPEV